MDKETLQRLIDSATTPQQMLTVARCYLRGEILRDKVAAEGWLMKVISLEDPVTGAQAMRLMAQEILGKLPLSPQEEADLRERLKTADAEEGQALLALLNESSGEIDKNIIDYDE